MSALRRLTIALVVLLACASPALACPSALSRSPLDALNSQTLSITSTAVGFTLPTTYASGGGTVTQVLEAVVYVTGGIINFYDNGNTPVASTTAGGAAFGSGAAGGTAFDVCGARALGLARMISQSGTATVVILYYGF